MSGGTRSQEARTTTYRLEVEGQLDKGGWSAWFDVDAVMIAGSNTVLEVRVADQSELFGRLRRIHDLNLRLVSVARIDEDTP